MATAHYHRLHRGHMHRRSMARGNGPITKRRLQRRGRTVCQWQEMAGALSHKAAATAAVVTEQPSNHVEAVLLLLAGVVGATEEEGTARRLISMHRAPLRPRHYHSMRLRQGCIRQEHTRQGPLLRARSTPPQPRFNPVLPQPASWRQHHYPVGDSSHHSLMATALSRHTLSRICCGCSSSWSRRSRHTMPSPRRQQQQQVVASGPSAPGVNDAAATSTRRASAQR